MSIVYILGAGATKAVASEAPLMNEFLPLAFEHLDDHRIERVCKFVTDFYLDSQSSPNTRNGQAFLPRLEDVLSQLDLSVAQRRPLSANYPLSEVRKLREDLVYLIARLLQDKLSGRRQDDVTDSLVRSLTVEDAIISLNYDIVVDNALVQVHDSPVVDYGVDIRLGYYEYPLNHFEYKSVRAQQEMPSNRLYKLHGSLNWLHCPNCQELDVTVGWKGSMQVFCEERPAICPCCHSPYETLIITPTLLKEYANHLLSQVWHNAEETITHADQLIFIGYSLADADVEIKCMIRRAMHKGRVLHGRRPKVTVVDRYISDTVNRDIPGTEASLGGHPRPPASQVTRVDREGSGTEAEERYRRLFGEIRYLPIGFAKYIKGLNR